MLMRRRLNDQCDRKSCHCVSISRHAARKKQPPARSKNPGGWLHVRGSCGRSGTAQPFSFAMMRSATFLPLNSMPPKMGPMRGVPDTALAAMPQT